MAKKRVKFKVGDRIIEDGRVYRIYKVRLNKNSDQKSKTIYFRPHYDKKEENGLFCSIPVFNIKDAGIRKPISKEKLKEVLKILSKKTNKKEKVNTISLKGELNVNKPKVAARILKKLWVDKKNKNTSFSPSKKAVYLKALRGLSEETAYVKKMPLNKARTILKKKLANSTAEFSSES